MVSHLPIEGIWLTHLTAVEDATWMNWRLASGLKYDWGEGRKSL